MRIEIISNKEELVRIRPQWERLLENSKNGSIFLSWEWLSTWWRIFGDGARSLMVVIVSDDRGETLSIAPFMLVKYRRLGFLPAVQLRFLATGEDERDEICSEYLDIIIRTDADEKSVSSALRELVFKVGWDEMVLERLRPGSFALSVFGSAIEGGSLEITEEPESLVLRLPASWDEFIRALPASHRYRVNRSIKSMKALGELELISADDEPALAKAFEKLVELHQERFTRKGRPGVFSSRKFTAFHESVSRELLARGRLMMLSLSLDKEVIGVIYNLVFGGSVLFYQSGINTAPSRANKWFKPGLVLHSLSVQRAISLGCVEYDFLSGDNNGYKMQWGPARRAMQSVTLRRGGLGMLRRTVSTSGNAV